MLQVDPKLDHYPIANEEIRRVVADDRLPDETKEHLIRIIVEADTGRVERFNAQVRKMQESGALFVDPQAADLSAEFQSVRWSSAHDSSCTGRVCLNPAHEPDSGNAIDVPSFDRSLPVLER